MQYAASTGVFYPDELQYDNIPADAIVVELKFFEQYMNSPPGSFITVNGGVATINAPTGPTLDDLKTAKIAELQAAYNAAIAAPVSYTTTAGTEATFSQDAQAKANLSQCLLAGQKKQDWSLNLWLDATGVPVTPFTYADLQGLAEAMEAADVPAYADLLAKVGQVNAARTAEAVAAIAF